MRTAIVEKPAQFRKMTRSLRDNGLEMETEGRLKRMPRGFDRVCEIDLGDAIRNRHFVVRQDIDPASIHGPALVDDLVDFALRAKPLLDWGRAIEATVPA